MMVIPFVLSLLILGAILVMNSRERFQPEFLDKTQVRQTIRNEDSSYAQTTNHMKYAPYSMGPIQGMQTPFQVNQYKAYVP
jgi:hypothetical protein